jgi:hypothetical protein
MVVDVLFCALAFAIWLSKYFPTTADAVSNIASFLITYLLPGFDIC